MTSKNSCVTYQTGGFNDYATLCKGARLLHLVLTFRNFNYPHDISIFVRELLKQNSTKRHATLRSIREPTKRSYKLCPTNANLTRKNVLAFFYLQLERSKFLHRAHVNSNPNAESSYKNSLTLMWGFLDTKYGNEPIPVAVWSKEKISNGLIAGIAGWNPDESLSLMFVVR